MILLITKNILNHSRCLREQLNQTMKCSPVDKYVSIYGASLVCSNVDTIDKSK